MGGSEEKIQEGWDICIHIAELLRSTAETNTTLKSNYPPPLSPKETWFKI